MPSRRNLARRGFTSRCRGAAGARGAAQAPSRSRPTGCAPSAMPTPRPSAWPRGRGRTSRRCSPRASTRRSAWRRPMQELAAVQAELEQWQLGLPNLLHESVPDGPMTRRECRGAPLGRAAARLSSSRGITSSSASASAGSISRRPRASPGARFVVMRARLRGCIVRSRSSCSICTRASTATREVYVPYLVRAARAVGTGQLPKFEQDLFAVQGRSRGVLSDPHRGSAR